MDKKFNFFESYHRALNRVPDASYGRVVRGMARYVFDGEEPTFDEAVDNVAWELIKPILERGQELSLVRSEAGKKGGERGKGVPRNSGNNHASKANQKQIKSGKGIGIGKGEGNNLELYMKKTSIPTLDQVQNYVAEKKFNIDVEYLYNFYEANGWRQKSGLPIKNWKAAVNNWNRNEQKYNQGNYGNTHRNTPQENIRAAQEQHIRQLAATLQTSENRDGGIFGYIPNDR